MDQLEDFLFVAVYLSEGALGLLLEQVEPLVVSSILDV